MTQPQIVCLGVNHRTAPIGVREQLSAPLAHFWEQTAFFPQLRELVVLATCNRLELYAVLDGSCSDPLEPLLDLLSAACAVDARAYRSYFYLHTEAAAAAHLLRVASGVDSLVLGEPQILGQVHKALKAARAAESGGAYLTLLFETAVRTGRRARSETQIGRHPTTVCALALSLARNRLGSIRDRHAVVVGLGEMGQLALKALQRRGVQHVTVVNRSRLRADELAAAHGCAVADLAQLDQLLHDADIVFMATAAQEPLIDAAAVRSALLARPRPLVLVDLSVPRNIAPDVAHVKGVHLFNIDMLRPKVDAALHKRQQAFPQVEQIVSAGVAEWQERRRGLAVRPTIVELRRQAEAIRQQELARTLRQMPALDEQLQQQVQHLTRALVNKLLHHPTQRLREQAVNGEAGDYVETVRDLFNLGE